MGKKLDFSEITKKYQQGGPVQQALPVDYHIEKPANPYTDISDLIEEETATMAPVDTSLIDKSKGLQGEKRAIYNKINGLQQQIKQKSTANKYWLGTKEGMAMLQELQRAAVLGANDLDQSKDHYDAARDRLKTNNSSDNFVMDINTGEYLVIDKSDGEVKRVSPYVFLQHKDKYQPIKNQQAMGMMESAVIDPTDPRRSIDFKENVATTLGQDKIMDELNTALSKAGSTKTGGGYDVFMALKELRNDPNVAGLMKSGDISGDSSVKRHLSGSTKDNLKQLERVVTNLLTDSNRMSTAARRSLENNITEQLLREGKEFDSPEAMQREVQKRMVNTLMQMAYEQQEYDHTENISDSVDKEYIPRNIAVGPMKTSMGMFKDLVVYNLSPDKFTAKDRLIPLGNKSELMNNTDINGIVIGNDNSNDPEFSPQEAELVMRNFHAYTGHAALIPVYTQPESKKGKVATDALSGEVTVDGDEITYRAWYERVHAKYLAEIDRLKKGGTPNEELGSDPEEVSANMKKELKGILQEAGATGLELRTVTMFRGVVEGDTKTFGKGIGERLQETGAMQDESSIAMKMASDKDSKMWQTTIYVPMNPNISLEEALWDKPGTTTRARGGKITLNKIGGRIMSFNQLK